METGNAKFHENGEVSGSVSKQVVDIQEIIVNFPTPIGIPLSITAKDVVLTNNVEQYMNDETPHARTDLLRSDENEPKTVQLRRSQRDRKYEIYDDYVVYLQESDFDIGINKDPVSFSQAI